MVDWLIKQRDDYYYTSNMHKSDQVRTIAQECPAKGKDFKTKIWDEFMKRLKVRFNIELKKVFNQDQDAEADNNFSKERIIDT